MSRIYENPPVIEAICEFRFDPGQQWDWTVPGLVYSEIKSEFPHKQEAHAIAAQVRQEQRELTYSMPMLEKMQFLREDKTAMVQVGPDMLAVNLLRHYPTWPQAKEVIANAFAAYRKVASPKGLLRIGLRFINRIQMPEAEVEIEDYLNATPTVPDQLPQRFNTWAQRVEIPIEKANGMLVLQAGSIREKGQDDVAFLLDLDFFTLDPTKISLDDAFDWVEQAHDEIEQAFEACITEKARSLFKEVAS